MFRLIAFALLANLACCEEAVLWTDPGSVATVDFSVGVGGSAFQPAPPFTFVNEDSGGTSPKVIVKDAKGIEWRVKGGLEVRAETFATRLVGALGYFAESTWFYPKGHIEGKIGQLSRASGFLQPDGNFTYASFERRYPECQFLSDTKWTWSRSPFAGTRELHGLKILVMLTSNWDNKDARDEQRGSNTAVLRCGSGSATKDIYFVNDWGQTFGGWGRLLGRSMWNCDAYRDQTKAFVTGVKGSEVQFGYAGQHTDGFRGDISVADVAWLMQYLGQVTDAQIRTGLLASGASIAEQECFTKSLRERIEQLRKIAGTSRDRPTR